jgi:hypothetical protein
MPVRPNLPVLIRLVEFQFPTIARDVETEFPKIIDELAKVTRPDLIGFEGTRVIVPVDAEGQKTPIAEVFRKALGF